jgi:hypothetical protein
MATPEMCCRTYLESLNASPFSKQPAEGLQLDRQYFDEGALILFLEKLGTPYYLPGISGASAGDLEGLGKPDRVDPSFVHLFPKSHLGHLRTIKVGARNVRKAPKRRRLRGRVALPLLARLFRQKFGYGRGRAAKGE